MTAIDVAGFPQSGVRSRATAGWTTRETVAAHASLTLFVAAAWGLWLWSGATVPWDSKNHFYPMFRFLADSLARGEAPLWNPYHFGGHPTVADPQSFLFTPTMAAFALIAPGASMQVFDAAIFAHLLAGGFAILGLFRRRGWGWEGAVLAGLVFILGGPASSRLQHTGMIISYAMLPVALLALEAALERPGLWRGVLAGVAATLMALGRDQVAFLGCGTLALATAWRVAEAEAPWAFLRGRLVMLAVAGLTTAALMALPTLLTLQLLAASNRPGIAFGVAATGSLDWINFATLFAPNVFGSINWDYSYFGPGYETSAEPDWTDRNINYLYVGLAPALLMLWHGLAGGRLFERGARFFGFLGLLATLYALGRATPAFEFAFDRLPGVSLYRRPADATFLMNFAYGVCAGYLLHRLRADGPPAIVWRGWRAAAPVAALALFAAVIVAALAFADQGRRFADAAMALAVPTIAALGLIAAMSIALRRGLLAPLALVLIASTAGQLLWRNAASSLNAEPLSRYSIYGTASDEERAALAALTADIAARGVAGARPRVEILGLSGPWMNASMMLKLEDTIGYNPLRLSDYQRAVGPGENAGDISLRRFPETFRGWRCRLAGLLGLEYLVLDRPLSRLPPHVPRPKSAVEIYAGQRMHVYRLGAAAPRAYVAARIVPFDAEDAFERRSLPEFDRTREALVDHDDAPDLARLMTPPAAGQGAAGTATIVSYSNDRVVIDVESPGRGLLVLHDLDYPGWVARVDGQERPVARANLLFRGVEVGPGRQRVEFVFRPFSLANLSAALRSVAARRQETQ